MKKKLFLLTMGYFNARSKPAAGTDETLYTAPSDAGRSCTLYICNQSGSSTVRVSIVPQADTPMEEHYILLDWPVSMTWWFPHITLYPKDRVIVQSNSGNVSFTLFMTDGQ